MPDREDLRFPFFVSKARRTDSDRDEIDCDYFSSHTEAKIAFETEKADDNIFVYLGELGALANEQGTLKIDYLVFDTNDYDWWRQCSSLNTLGSRGFGRAWEHDSYATRYEPLAELNWRL